MLINAAVITGRPFCGCRSFAGRPISGRCSRLSAARFVSGFLESIFIDQATLNGTRSEFTLRCQAGCDPFVSGDGGRDSRPQ
jgi:hypothetical protein